MSKDYTPRLKVGDVFRRVVHGKTEFWKIEEICPARAFSFYNNLPSYDVRLCNSNGKEFKRRTGFNAKGIDEEIFDFQYVDAKGNPTGKNPNYWYVGFFPKKEVVSRVNIQVGVWRRQVKQLESSIIYKTKKLEELKQKIAEHDNKH